MDKYLEALNKLLSQHYIDDSVLLLNTLWTFPCCDNQYSEETSVQLTPGKKVNNNIRVLNITGEKFIHLVYYIL